jgi:hypothetical protein
MVADEAFDRLAPPQEAGHLRHPHPCQREGDDRLVPLPPACSDRQVGQGGQCRPPAEELQTHVPTPREMGSERILRQEPVDGCVVSPLREDGQTTQLQPVGRHGGRSEPHQRQGLDMVEPRRGGEGRWP